MRISEAIALQIGDVDLQSGIINVRKGKNGRQRLLPVTECTNTYLNEYARKRVRLVAHSANTFFFSDGGLALTDCAVRYNFARVCQRIGLRTTQRFHRHGTGPRVHDLRHTFAVKVMINWYKQGQDINVEILKLVNYLGHQQLSHTYWYLEAIPELLALASGRMEDDRKEVRSW